MGVVGPPERDEAGLRSLLARQAICPQDHTMGAVCAQTAPIASDTLGQAGPGHVGAPRVSVRRAYVLEPVSPS